MAPPFGRNRTPVSEQLYKEPWKFQFYQAVRLLEQLARVRHVHAGEPARVPVGLDRDPADEVVHFIVPPGRSFPPAEIAALNRPEPGENGRTPPPTMTVNFLGMIGPSGVMPQHYTQLAIDRVRRFKDTTFRDFLDLFHHRTISLFFRAWEKYRFPIGYERSALDAGPDAEDQFTWFLYCLTGLGTGQIRGRLDMEDETFLYYAGHFSDAPPRAVVLETLVSDCFELDASVLQFQGQWLYLRPPDQSRLPDPATPRGFNNRLGTDTVIGERVWDVASKFRIRLGPLDYRDFMTFTPAGGRLPLLGQFVRMYVNREFDFDVQVVLRADCVPQTRLGGTDTIPSNLGWNSWLTSRTPDCDATEAVFTHEGLPAAGR